MGKVDNGHPYELYFRAPCVGVRLGRLVDDRGE